MVTVTEVMVGDRGGDRGDGGGGGGDGDGELAPVLILMLVLKFMSFVLMFAFVLT